MAKKFNAAYNYVLTANTLATGDVVFWTGSKWDTSILSGHFASGESGVQALEQIAVQEEGANTVVGAYLAPFNLDLQPVELREQRRLQGPSIDFLSNAVVSERLAA